MSQVKKIPMRKCVGCQEMKSKREMIRILKTESEGIILDATGKKNGRGAYICRSGECLEKAIRNHCFKGRNHFLFLSILLWSNEVSFPVVHSTEDI